MFVKFEDKLEREQVEATLKRLMTELHERSHTSGEMENLAKALFCVRHTAIEETK